MTLSASGNIDEQNGSGNARTSLWQQARTKAFVALTVLGILGGLVSAFTDVWSLGSHGPADVIASSEARTMVSPPSLPPASAANGASSSARPARPASSTPAVVPTTPSGPTTPAGPAVPRL